MTFTGTASTPRSPTRSPTSPAKVAGRDVYNNLLTDLPPGGGGRRGVWFTTKPLDFGVLSDDTLPLVDCSTSTTARSRSGTSS